MQAPEMGGIDTSLAMFPDEHHHLPDFSYQDSRTPPPRRSHRCRSCCSLYYKDPQGYLRVIPGPGPTRFDPSRPWLRRPWTIRAGEINFHSDFCIICRLIRGLIAGVTTGCEDVELKTLSDGSCMASVQSHFFGGWLVPERELHRYNVVSGTKISRADLLDPDMICRWIKTCQNSHSPRNNPVRLSRLSNPVDITLIDVINQRLIYASSSMPFCALSYVWGGMEGFKTTSTNRAVLGLPGSLQQPQVLSQIPQAIKDAMRLVSLIGERFLWVDALCIQQDNPAMKHSQVMQMDIIYGHAMLTIVNLPGKNADAPLPRVPSEADVQLGRFLKQQTGQVNRAGLVAVRQAAAMAVEISSHATRAWTFQERLLSQRCLFLGEDHCFFFCHSQLQAELTCGEGFNFALDILPDWNCGPPEWFVDLSLYSRSENSDKASVQFGHFQRLLMTYRHKKLSWESDTLNAFSGILAALAEQTGWSFLSGLPEQHLEFRLLWMPEGKRPIRRIEGFPTWSWAAWDCVPTWNRRFVCLSTLRYAQKGRTEIDGLHTFRQTPRRPISSEPPVSIGTSSPLDARAGIDVLAFHAYTVSSQYFDLRYNDSWQYYPKIFDLEQRPCGFRDPSSAAIEDVNEAMEIVLLSRFQFEEREKRREVTDDYTTLFYEEQYPHSQWAFLNVMFIRWEGGYAERVCVGLMHERAFMNAGPSWKEILLA